DVNRLVEYRAVWLEAVDDLVATVRRDRDDQVGVDGMLREVDERPGILQVDPSAVLFRHGGRCDFVVLKHRCALDDRTLEAGVMRTRRRSRHELARWARAVATSGERQGHECERRVSKN